jgi:DNA-binding helix-hairpin-helix protein with protein kinase domain
MALLDNQRKAIQDTVNRGDVLPSALSSALLAALEEAETSWQRISVALQVERASVAKLELERDEILQIKRSVLNLKGELETEIDRRVNILTEELRSELRLAKTHQERADKSATFYEKLYQDERQNWMAHQSQMSGIIYELKGLIEQQMPEGFLKRLNWKRAARRVLKEADRLDPRQF